MPAKSEAQRRLMEGVKHGTIHKPGLTPATAKKVLGEGERKPAPKPGTRRGR
jgi:hypothetical protein